MLSKILNELKHYPTGKKRGVQSKPVSNLNYTMGSKALDDSLMAEYRVEAVWTHTFMCNECQLPVALEQSRHELMFELFGDLEMNLRGILFNVLAGDTDKAAEKIKLIMDELRA